MTPPKTTILGIAGGSGSGKTTFAAALLHTLSHSTPPLRAQIFHADHYVQQDQTHGPKFFSPSTGQEQFDWNHPDTVDHARLLTDLDTRLNTPDPPQIIIVEGLMVLAIPELRDRLNLRLYVDLDPDERVLRRLLRNIEKGQSPKFIADYYRESARPGHARFVQPSRLHADFIIPGNADFSRITNLLVKMLIQITVTDYPPS